MWWHPSVIPSFVRLRQEDQELRLHSELKTSLDYAGDPVSKTKKEEIRYPLAPIRNTHNHDFTSHSQVNLAKPERAINITLPESHQFTTYTWNSF